tara:strand:- start:475 stop:762 length:288 start_codon:yes stop_codon:yes gene_type:complete
VQKYFILESSHVTPLEQILTKDQCCLLLNLSKAYKRIFPYRLQENSFKAIATSSKVSTQSDRNSFKYRLILQKSVPTGVPKFKSSAPTFSFGILG